MNITESMLAAFWKSGALRGRDLQAADGRRVRVLHPGLVGDDGGPDFRDAAIVWQHDSPCPLALRGDVELHTDSRLWRQHGHHRDPRFNCVVLHVVVSHEAGNRTILENGDCVPVLPLGELMRGALKGTRFSATSPPSCRKQCARPSRLGRILARAGEERFRLKADRFEAQICAFGPGQALYSGMMEVMGYARNREPFRELAARLPLAVLEDRPSLEEREALLLAMAGLLWHSGGSPPNEEAPGADGPGVIVEPTFVAAAPAGSMDAARWDLVHVRPSNSPLRRLAAMARLLGTWRGGMLVGLMDLVKTAPGGSAAETLIAALVVPTDGPGEGRPSLRQDPGQFPRRMALVGKGRAGDLAVNAVLPFALAWSQSVKARSLHSAALSLYREHRALSENRVTRHMANQVWGERPRMLLSAAEQQGLMHLYHTFCALGNCAQCPLSTSG